MGIYLQKEDLQMCGKGKGATKKVQAPKAEQLWRASLLWALWWREDSDYHQNTQESWREVHFERNAVL